MNHWPKLILFSLLPAALLLASAEIVIRLADLTRPSIFTLPLPEEEANLLQPDDDLFWSLRPNIDTDFSGFPLQTNSLGLRSQEVETKREGELRILSLGESSTFGFGVANRETYSALLPSFLMPLMDSKDITTINAGVSAYSSFQSLKYLELRGLALEPDIILFYHEVNDYLPSALRDSSNNEVGVTQTDKQLFESTQNRFVNAAMRHSALLRFLSLRRARGKLERLNKEDFSNPLTHIGMAPIGVQRRLVTDEAASSPGSEQPFSGLNERSLGQRVSEEERFENLSRLLKLSGDRGIKLVLIHPSYAYSERHECVLTRFAESNHVLMYDAHKALHSREIPDGVLFLDYWHPSPRGHVRLASALSRFIAENQD